MAEIEHFCDPDNKSHTKFQSVKDVELTLYSAGNQMNGTFPEKIAVGDAVQRVSVLVCTVKSLKYFVQC